MFVNHPESTEYIFLSTEEQIQLKIVDNLITEAKISGQKSCTWYNLKENVVKQLEQMNYKVTSKKYLSLEIFTIHLPQNPKSIN